MFRVMKAPINDAGNTMSAHAQTIGVYSTYDKAGHRLEQEYANERVFPNRPRHTVWIVDTTKSTS